MALAPSINVCLQSGCTELILRETTGIYNDSTNTGGYGFPNPVVGDITAVTLQVTDPSDVIYTIDLSDTDFPSSNEDFEYSIPLSLLDRDSIEDGYWYFKYIVSVDETDYEAIAPVFFYCNARCCAERLLATIDVDADNNNITNNKKIDNYTKVRTFLSSLINAANCGNTTQFNKIKTLISRLCRNTTCKTCN